ncbi:MAG: tetratricopeptide repeat protein [Tepidisphaeraceae bacterium]
MSDLPADPQFSAALELHRSGRLDDAARAYRGCLDSRPDEPEVLHMLGVVMLQMRKAADAADLFWRAISLNPASPIYHSNLGEALRVTGRLTEARDSIRRAIALSPDLAPLHANLANVLMGLGQTQQAIESWETALRLDPHDKSAWFALGRAFQSLNDVSGAQSSYERVLCLDPRNAAALNNLGVLQHTQACYAGAIARFQAVLAVNPRDAGAATNLGTALFDSGCVNEAIQSYRRAIELAPQSTTAASNLLHALHAAPGVTMHDLVDEHRRLAGVFGSASAPATHANNRDSERPLRVGYLSADFREHALRFFVEPILGGHDRTRVEVTGYASVARPDAVTAHLQRHCGRWRDVSGMSDDDAAALVREDAIDILVDLGVHSAHNRLPILSRRPAPIQMSYLGYPGTTGLEAVDYRLSDFAIDPADDDPGVERVLRLPRSYFCYQPPHDAPDIGPSPAEKNRVVTFGAFNRLAKTTTEIIALWCRVLRDVPESRLTMMALGLGEPATRDLTLDRFDKDVRARVRLLGPSGLAGYLTALTQVDVVLDTFPFNGGTTTCHALWMGAPVISLSGATPVSRMGRSILRNIGLEDLATDTPDFYVQTASTLARDGDRLTRLRGGLRDRLRSSALMDAKHFCRDLESCYREVWRQWCSARRG